MELRATSMAVGGDAVARDAGGRVVFVRGALPGELVEVTVGEERADFARATATAVLDPSAERVAPPCPHVARGCGGCGWQHVAHDAQRRLKVGLVTESLQRLGRVADPAVHVGPTLDPAGHRTTLRLTVRDGRAGFHRFHDHEVVDVDSCLVAHPLLSDLLEADFGAATEATLRCGVATGERLALLAPTAEGARFPDDVTVVGADELRGGRRAFHHEVVAGHRFRVSARSFFQARPDGAEALVRLARAALAGAADGPLVDLFGGVGLFGATLGQGRRVTLVERASSAVADARVNVAGVKALLVDVERWRPSSAAAVVADPARKGLGRVGVDAVAGTGATHLALVSCDPASLGRDTALLAAAGFGHAGSTLVDLFPHTPHVEVVTRFVRDRPAGAGRRRAKG